MFVLDPKNGRINVYSPSGTYVRAFPSRLAKMGFDHSFNDSLVFVNEMLYDRARVGLPVHVYRADGSYVRSLGPELMFANVAATSIPFRVVATSVNSLWIIDPLKYELQKWSLAGAHVLSVARPAPWFVRSDSLQRRPEPDMIPQTRVVDALEDRGLLWVAVAVPDSRWRSSFGKPRTVAGPARVVGGRQYHPVEDFTRYYDTVIDVFDAAGRLLASTRIDAVITQILPGGAAIGLPKGVRDGLDVWHLELVR
jgi:hypothetical protein